MFSKTTLQIPKSWGNDFLVDLPYKNAKVNPSRWTQVLQYAKTYGKGKNVRQVTVVVNINDSTVFFVCNSSYFLHDIKNNAWNI